jgi:hypothetical protein
MKTSCRLLIAAVVFACFAGHGEAAKAKTYSKQVQRACASDYRRYCGEYGIQTSSLRSCMRRVGQRLSKGCVDALVASGEVSRPVVKKGAVTQAKVRHRKRR